MGYRVSYDLVSAPKVRRNKKWTGIAAIAVICVLLICATVFKTAALPWIRDFLIPGDPDVTATALTELVNDLRDGVSFTDAVTTFCREIISNGQTG